MTQTIKASPDAVRSLRVVAGLDARALARRAGIGRNTLWRIEQGLVAPQASTLRAIADALGVPVSALLANEAVAR